MAAISTWARLDLRLRWRSLVALALLTALAATVTMAALAGARRADSALERLTDVTEPATVAILQVEPGFDYGPLEDLPYVTATARFITGGLGELGDGISIDALADSPTDPALLTDLERPVVLSGRLYDSDAIDEAVVTQRFADRWAKGVGETVELRFPAPEQIGMGDSEAGPLRGRRVELHVVGIIRSPYYADWPGEVGTILPSPGLARAYPKSYFGVDGRKDPSTSEEILVRLDAGAAQVDRLRADLARLTGRDDLDVQDLHEEYARRQHSIDFEARSLTALGLAAAIASLVLVGQSILRQVGGTRDRLRTASALGMTRSQAVGAAAAGPVVAGSVGAALAVVAAASMSRVFPIGTARQLEPEPGVRLDLLVLTSGAVLTVVLVVLAATVGALAATRPLRHAARRRSTVASRLAAMGLPLPVAVGSRLALEPERGPAAVPVRSTLVASVAGVLGLVAVTVVGAGVSESVDHPERYGQTFDSGFFTGFGGQEYIPTDGVEAALATDDRVVGIGSPRVAVATDASGTASVSLFSQEESALPVSPVVLSGRAPETDGEVLLAPSSAADLDVEVGDQIALSGDKGAADLAVVGTGLMTEGPNNRFDEGGLVTAADFDRLFTGFDFRLMLVRLTSQAAGDADVHDDLTAVVLRALPEHSDSGFEIGPAGNGLLVQQLEQVRALPLALGIFLALLACAALAHALLTSVRRRARDLATLRAIGSTPAQTRSVVLVQALVVAGAGLLVGVPLGFALGRTVWRSVAAYTPLQHVPPAVLGSLLTIISATAVVALLLAWWPARRAAKSRVADILRTE